MGLTRWQSDAVTSPLPPWPLPPFWIAMRRGLRGVCPVCGRSALFRGFLRVSPDCSACGVPLQLVPADDAPSYFTVLLTAIIIVPLMLALALLEGPPAWLMAAVFLPLSPALAITLLRPVKGATIGVMLALNMLTPNVDEA